MSRKKSLLSETSEFTDTKIDDKNSSKPKKKKWSLKKKLFISLLLIVAFVSSGFLYEYKQKRSHFVHYKFVPGFGFYGLGLMHFLGNLTMTATAAMRNLVDAGQFSNLPGGFKAKGVRMVGDNDPIAPGEFKEVEATGIDLNPSAIEFVLIIPPKTLHKIPLTSLSE